MPLTAIEAALQAHINQLVAISEEGFAEILPYFGQRGYTSTYCKPTALHATYYAQRASAGPLISEATSISLQARG